MIPLLLANWRFVLKAAVALAVSGSLAWVALALIDHGRMKERQAMTQRVETDRSKADVAERDVLDCPAGKWDREAMRCER